MVLAFFIGLIASVHCVGMCGPLMFALPIEGGSWFHHLSPQLLYQSGRILSYSFLGFLLGMLGAGAALKGWQQYASLLSGSILVLLAFFYFMQRYGFGRRSYGDAFIQPLLNKMGFWLRRPGGHFMVGILNGFLPCGMVYLALATALNTGSPLNGALFMALFGLGTMPLLLLTTTFGRYFMGRHLKVRFASLLPVLFLVMGIWFILRGANLNIAYLSPLLYPESGGMFCR
ncbi:sulfite exporter TauE/SafE family protein [Olivibacter sp. XZL3]|uniref:sulfite exporter TauE/SafE family protein n=1 Tax=Olivibacter sp. XZL3 TaxID=1735116 RepID=UPI001066D306|nr:sulfite exporter TauE/SafE family protein [Olivibacter sp. XZL3]